MNFIDAAESGLSKWCTFSGRASRSEYWYFTLFYMLISVVGTYVSNPLYTYVDIPPTQYTWTQTALCAFGIFLDAVYNMWIFIAGISIAVRRLHDVNRSGWWYWIGLTIIGAIYPLLIWNIRKGTEGPNRFGPDPLQGTEGNMIR